MMSKRNLEARTVQDIMGNSDTFGGKLVMGTLDKFYRWFDEDGDRTSSMHVYRNLTYGTIALNSIKLQICDVNEQLEQVPWRNVNDWGNMRCGSYSYERLIVEEIGQKKKIDLRPSLNTCMKALKVL